MQSERYATALRRNTTRPPVHHHRPRSLFLRVPEDAKYEEIWDDLCENEIAKRYIDKIESLWEMRRGMYIMSFFKDKNGPKTRDALYAQIEKQGLEGHSFRYIRMELPRPPATHLIASGIPTETEPPSVRRDINSQGFGTVVALTRVYRKNTRIYNGRTNIWVESFDKDKMPSIIYIDGYPCQIRTAEDIYKKRCYLCNEEGHVARECQRKNEENENEENIETDTGKNTEAKKLPEENRIRLGTTNDVRLEQHSNDSQNNGAICDWFVQVGKARAKEHKRVHALKNSKKTEIASKPRNQLPKPKVDQTRAPMDIEDSPASSHIKERQGDSNPRVSSETEPFDDHNETIIDQDSLVSESNKRARGSSSNTSTETISEKKIKNDSTDGYDTDLSLSPDNSKKK